METQFFHIISLLLALIFGSPEGDMAGQRQNIRQYFPADVPVYVNVDMGMLRQFIGKQPQLLQMAFRGRDRVKVYEEAISKLSSEMGFSADVLKDAFTGIKSVSFALLGFGEREYQMRVVLVVDRGQGRKDVLSPLLTRFTDSRKYLAIDYAGSTIHVFQKRRGQGIFLTEKDGKIVFALDQMSIQKFLLKTQQNNQASAAENNAIVHAEANADPIFGAILATMSRYDRYDFFVMNNLFDFASWQKLLVNLNNDGMLDVSLKMHPAGKLNKVLARPLYPAQLLRYISKDTAVAAAVSLKDPLVFWQCLKSSIALVQKIEGRDSRENELERKFREMGLDIEKDVFANIAEAMYMVPTMRRERDLERNAMFLFLVRDIGKAKTTIDNFIKVVDRRGNVKFSTRDSLYIWDARDVKLLLYNNVFILTPIRKSVDEIIKYLDDNQAFHYEDHLHKIYSPATSFLHFNPSNMLPLQVEPFSLGLSFENSTLTVKSYFDMAKISQKIQEFLEKQNAGRRAPKKDSAISPRERR